MAAIGTGVVDVSSVEKELNDKYANNPNIRINDIVILGYVTDYSYYPIEFNIVDGMITLDNNSNLLNRRLFVCSNRQYLNETYTSANKDYTASSNIIELRFNIELIKIEGKEEKKKLSDLLTSLDYRDILNEQECIYIIIYL